MSDGAIVRQQMTVLKETAEQLRNELAACDEVGRGLMMAIAITQLQTMLLDQGYISSLASLKGSPLGFQTDEGSNRKYSNEEVAAFVVHCLLDGDPLYGGHVMIFSGKKYRTKAGWLRLLKLAKVTELDVRSAAPQDVVETRTHNGNTRASGKCAAYAQCRLNGQHYRIDFANTPHGDFRVDVDGNGRDGGACRVQMRGKAEARAAARLYQLITGIDCDEDGPGQVIDAVAEPATWTLSPDLEGYMDQAIAHNEQQVAARAASVIPSPPVTAPDFIDEVAALQGKLSPEHATLLGDAHADLAGAKSEQQLRTIWEAINAAAREAKLDSRGMALLTRIKDDRKAVLSGT